MLGYRCFRCNADHGTSPLVEVPWARNPADVENAFYAHGRLIHDDPPGRHGVWLVVKSLADRPYPCRCHERLYEKCSPKYCPCNGRDDIESVPADCCARLAAERSLRLASSQRPVVDRPDSFEGPALPDAA